MPFVAGSVEFRFELEGEVQMHRRLTGVMARMISWRPAFRLIAEDFRAHMASVFDSEGGATKSGQWPPLSSAYAKWKARHYPGRPILVRTGTLRESLTKAGHPEAIQDLSDDALSIGTSVPYAIYHQSIRPRKRLPRRAMIDLPESVKARWLQILAHTLWQEREP